MTDKVPMTLEGAEKLREELNRLKFTDRPAVIEAISEARKHGDLKENAEYHAAKEQQGFIEGRIREVEAKLAHATVVDVTKLENTGRIVFGVTVRLFNLSTEEIEEYKIVGEDEADIKLKKISVKSPIARALIGHHLGDEVEVITPSGTRQFEVQEVLYV